MSAERRRLLLISCFSLLAVALAYANSLPNDFIRDDSLLIPTNPAIRSIHPIQNLLTPFWGEKSQLGIYRPFVIFSFSLEYPFWKTRPAGYRGVNILLHGINGILVYLIASSLIPPTAACAAAVVFVLHPVHTEAVAGVAGRSELLAALFFFTAWLLFRRGRTAVASLAFLLALLSKETAIMFPAVMAVEMWIFGGSFKKVLLQWKRFIGLVVAAGIYLVLRASVLGQLGMPRSAQYLNGQWTLLQRELTSGRAFLAYFRLLLAPVKVTGDYDFNSIPLANANAIDAWLGIFLIVMSIVLAIGLRKKVPVVAFVIVFFYAALLPVSNWILPSGLIMAERYLYVPSLGFAILAGLTWSKVDTRERRLIAACGYCGIATLLCMAHNYVWRGNLSYYENIVSVYPNNVAARQGYGVALLEAGHAEQALQQFEAGLKVAKDPPLLTGLAGAKIRLEGNCVNARPLLEEALQMANEYFARWTLAQCFANEGDFVKSEATYRQAIADAQFPDPKLFVDWGRVLEKLGRHDDALHAYERASSR